MALSALCLSGLLGKKHMAAVTLTPQEEQLTASSGLISISSYVTAHTNAFFVCAQPRDIMADIENRQTLYLVLCILVQLLVLDFMNYSTYYPYHQLMKSLQSRGFVKQGRRPTFAKVVRFVFIEGPPRVWWAVIKWWRDDEPLPLSSSDNPQDKVAVEAQRQDRGGTGPSAAQVAYNSGS